MEFTEEYINFVKTHADADPNKLRLRFHKDSRPWLSYAINNIAALKKARKFRTSNGEDFTPCIIPLEISGQQATSATIAKFHSSFITKGASILDMTFGLGMDAQLISRIPDAKILGFDLQEELVAAAKVNFKEQKNVEVLHGNSVEFLEHYSGANFDVIFIDPARRGSEGERLYNLHDCQPDLIELLPLIRQHANKLIAKLSPMLDVSQTLRDLPGVCQLHVVEEANECKELLAIIDFQQSLDEPQIVIDRFVKGELQQFQFIQTVERNSSSSCLNRKPNVGEYLIEPSAATMKAAPFNSLSAQFSIASLHSNTHLYISSAEQSSFPGTMFEIEQVLDFSSSNLKQISKSISQADIVVRNLKGFTPDILRKRLKIKQGGNRRLYATTIALPGGASSILLLVKPI
jgi:hypothetical protein